MTINKINITLLLLLFVAGYLLINREPSPVKIVQSTIVRDTTIIDTLTITEFKYVTKEFVRVDTLTIRDSITVYVPISQKRYKGIGYDILAEGYNVELLEVNIFPEKHYIDKIVSRETTLVPPKISHGFNFGIGLMYGSKGLDFGAYVGYGITIRL